MGRSTIGRRAWTMLLSLMLMIAFLPVLGSTVHGTEREWTNISTEDYGITISTDKAKYDKGEDVHYSITGFANTGKGENTLWLGLYEYGAADGYQTSLAWRYINADVEDGLLLSDLNPSNGLEAGKKYHLILTTGGAGNDTGSIWATLDFSMVDNETYDDYYLELANTHYPERVWGEHHPEGGFCPNTHATVKAAAPEGSNAWVGVYQAEETNPSSGLLFAYDYVAATSLEDEGAELDLSSPKNKGKVKDDFFIKNGGCYKFVLFKDGGYTAVKEICFFVRGAHTLPLTPVEEKEASCTEDGYKAHFKCSACGTLFSDEAGKTEISEPEVIKAGHLWDKGTVIKKATLGEEGIRTITCTECGEKKDESIARIELKTPKAATQSVSGGKMLVSWSKVTGADGYVVSWKKSGAKKWNTKRITAQKTTLSGMKSGAMYQYRVAATKKATATTAAVTGKYSTISYRFYQNLKGQKYKAARRAVKVSWKKAPGATGYQVLLATNKNMSGAKVYTVYGKAKTGYTVKNLKKGKTYYMAARPIKKSGGKTYIGIRPYGKAIKVK